MSEVLVIGRRFRGPPASANGGYACGLLAAALGAQAAEVSLRKPPPLDHPLRLRRANGDVSLVDGEAVVADGRALDDLDVDLPSPPSLEVAADADRRYPYYDGHSFPSCFVCGPDRPVGDGLRIYPGTIEGRSILACAWTPASDLADAAGAVRAEIVWAALDCPSGLAAMHFTGDDRAMVLARLRARIDARIQAGRPHIVVGWPISNEGRKHEAGTAIFDASGVPLACSQALWIEPRAPA